MLITTANDLPGYEITETLGEVFGLTVRSRNVGSQLGAGLKSIMGGELKGMTKALVDSREQVIERMVEEASAKGADAIVASSARVTILKLRPVVPSELPDKLRASPNLAGAA